MGKITVLSPVGRSPRDRGRCRRCRPICAGLAVGFLDNTKHNFDRLAEGMGALLTERFGVRRIVHRRKANAAATGAAPEIVATSPRSAISSSRAPAD